MVQFVVVFVVDALAVEDEAVVGVVVQFVLDMVFLKTNESCAKI